MIWSEETEPNEECEYTHVSCKTPLGTFLITWKSWKPSSPLDIQLDEHWFDNPPSSLDEAKVFAREYLIKKRNELTEFLREEK